jgi:hypothetical protein
MCVGVAASHRDLRPIASTPPPGPLNCCASRFVRGSMRDSGMPGTLIPDRALADGDRPGGGCDACLDRFRHLRGFRIDARHRAVAAVERPHTAFTTGDGDWRGPNLDRFLNHIAVAVHANGLRAARRDDPDRVARHGDGATRGRQCDVRNHRIGVGIDAYERTSAVGQHPHASCRARERARATDSYFDLVQRALVGLGAAAGVAAG